MTTRSPITNSCKSTISGCHRCGRTASPVGRRICVPSHHVSAIVTRGIMASACVPKVYRLGQLAEALALGRRQEKVADAVPERVLWGRVALLKVEETRPVGGPAGKAVAHRRLACGEVAAVDVHHEAGHVDEALARGDAPAQPLRRRRKQFECLDVLVLAYDARVFAVVGASRALRVAQLHQVDPTVVRARRRKVVARLTDVRAARAECALDVGAHVTLAPRPQWVRVCVNTACILSHTPRDKSIHSTHGHRHSNTEHRWARTSFDVEKAAMNGPLPGNDPTPPLKSRSRRYAA
jgi:hypothetical protein